MNNVDTIIIAILVISTVLGLYWGLIRQVLSVVGLIAAMTLAGRYGSDVADALSSLVSNELLAQALGFIIVLVAVSSVVSLLATLLRRFVGLLFLGWLDHLAGGLLGLIQGGLVCTILLAVGATFPNELWSPALSESRLAPMLLRVFAAALLLPESFQLATQMVLSAS